MDEQQRRQARLAWMLRRARLVEQISDARKHGSAVFNSTRRRHRLVPGEVQMRAARRVELLQQQLKTFDDQMRRYFLDQEVDGDG